MSISDEFAARTIGVHGETGRRWLNRLPDLLADCEQRWSLTVGPPLASLTYNYVAPATRVDGARAILKLGVPNKELSTEIASLRLYDGRGAVRLLKADAERGALLLERIEPGIPLSSLVDTDDEQATSIAVSLMRRLWRPVSRGHPFPTIVEWARGLNRLRQRFDGETGPLPEALVEEAERLFDELLGTITRPVVLHGDLHHDNILSATREPWLAIDPKGVIGEPAYDVAIALRDPMPKLLTLPHPSRTLARRLDQIAEETGFDRARIRGWGLAQAVLSAWWDLEESQPSWRQWIDCAELIAAIPE